MNNCKDNFIKNISSNSRFIFKIKKKYLYMYKNIYVK